MWPGSKSCKCKRDGAQCQVDAKSARDHQGPEGPGRGERKARTTCEPRNTPNTFTSNYYALYASLYPY